MKKGSRQLKREKNNQNNKKKSHQKLSSRLFFIASLLALLSLILSDFESSIWGFISLMNFVTGFIMWVQYKKEENMKGDEKNEQKED